MVMVVGWCTEIIKTYLWYFVAGILNVMAGVFLTRFVHGVVVVI